MNINLNPDLISGRTDQEKLTNLGFSSEFKAAVTAHAYAPLIGEQDLATVFQQIGEVSIRSVKEGSKDIEFMLTSQVIALDSIFNRLAIQAHSSIGKHPKVVDTYLRLALKAQSQCRATAETLATVKSPKQYINQTNVAGAMQINIDMEKQNVDRGAETKDATSNSRVETLGEIYGSQDTQRESDLQQEFAETRNVLG